jgi:signal transduction histidine kinase
MHDTAGSKPATGEIVDILLVDDQQASLDALEAVLEPSDYRIIHARSAQEALLTLLDGEFAAIVLDINMPLVNGIELARIIKQRARTRDIPILFLTAYLVDEQDVLLGYDAGAVDYLSKPVHPRILRSKIAAYVDLYRKTRALAEANAALSLEVSERVKAQEALREANRGLEKRVEERTAELRAAMEREYAARVEAEEQSRLKEEFLAIVSHELRTPLNAIYGWSELLGRSGIKPEVVTEGLAAIRRNAKAQAHLIEDLLDMSRIASGKARLDKVPVNVVEIVAAAAQTVQPTAVANGVQLEMPEGIASGHGQAVVMGDPGRLQQIIGNLLSNAVKFTPRGGSVTVHLDATGAEVEIGVRDTGQGIDPRFLPHLFSKFRQADGSTTRRHGGLGLGLSIVRQLVELHGGRVRAESAGVGKGALFAVRLPLMQASTPAGSEAGLDQAAAQGAADVAAIVLAGRRVLAVDDEADARQLIQHVLGELGALVTVAASADEALSLLHAHRFDVLVSDIGMAGADGYELIRNIRAREGDGERMPAIALTAYARHEDRAVALAAGFDEHLAKPLDACQLAAVIARLVRRSDPEPAEAA